LKKASVAAGALLIVVVAVGAFVILKGSQTGGKSVSKRGPKTHMLDSGGEMVFVSGGEFLMGDAAGRPDETPHTVAVSSFYIDKCPVTQQHYERVMGNNPSKWKSERNPVERLRWAEAARFCNKCSEIDGLTPCYDTESFECDFDADGYRLPTEAEWEYACRAGKQTKYFFGDDPAVLPQFAWLKANSEGRARPVGTKLPNDWGLYDMHGNVWEWCNDYYGENYYKEGPKKDPRGPATGKLRVMRGGAWDSNAQKCRAAYRFKEYPSYADACFGNDNYGFRRVRKLKKVLKEAE